MVLLANKIQELSLTREAIATNATSIPEWNDFASYVQQQNTLQAPDAWECGLPSTMDPTGMDSETEFDNELDLEPSNSGGGGGAGGAGGGGMHAGPDYRYGTFQTASEGSDDQEEASDEDGEGSGVVEEEQGGGMEEVTGMTATMTIQGDEVEEEGGAMVDEMPLEEEEEHGEAQEGAHPEEAQEGEIKGASENGGEQQQRTTQAGG